MNKGPRTKGAMDRSIAADGIYGNARFMHTAASLVGSIVQIHTIEGLVYEGVFRTFSPQFEFVIEMAHELDKTVQKNNQFVAPNKEAIISKIIFRMRDIEMLTIANSDLDYATKDVFATDTAISKFNGQISERELEPWDESQAETSEFTTLEAGDSANGWDVNDMFRTNEQQYGVQSTYDNSLAGYTIPLEKKNTDEYKKQEAKAIQIANEIETSVNYRARIATEDTDEGEKISAVVRPAENSNCVGKYVPPAKRKPPLGGGGGKLRSTPSPQSSYGGGPPRSPMLSHSQQQQQHTPMPSSTHGMHSLSGGPPPPQHVSLGSTRHHTHVSPSNNHPGGIPPTVPPVHVPAAPQPSNCNNNANKAPPLAQINESELKVNGGGGGSGSDKMIVAENKDVLVDTKKYSSVVAAASVENDHKSSSNVEVVSRESETTKLISNSELSSAPLSLPATAVPPVAASQLTSNHISSKISRKNLSTKAVSREEETSDLKKFKSNFLLSEERKEESSRVAEDAENKQEKEVNLDKITDTLKKSNLNPNAKEFVMNPNAKSFTPRSPGTQTPTPPRAHTPGAMVGQPQAIPLVPSQHIFTSLPTHPQYNVMMPATQLSAVSLAGPLNALQQGSRFRKTTPTTVQQRPEFSPAMHVAAATGQPILASTTMVTQPSFVPYAPQGMVPAHGNPQHSMPYTQMYSVVGPTRLMPTQSMAMVASHLMTHPDSQHVPSQMFAVSAHPGVPQALSSGTPPHPSQTPIPAMTQGGPHPNPSSAQQASLGGQTQVTALHPNPSPSAHSNASNQSAQPTTPGAQLSAYSAAAAAAGPPQMGQGPLQPGPHTPNSPQAMHPAATPSSMAPTNPHFHPASIVSHAGSGHSGHPGTAPQGHPHAAAFPGGHQQMVLIHQQGHGTPTQLGPHQQAIPTHTLQGHALHGPTTQAQVAHLMPHTSMVIPATSSGPVPGQHQIFIQPHSVGSLSAVDSPHPLRVCWPVAAHHPHGPPQAQAYPHAQ